MKTKRLLSIVFATLILCSCGKKVLLDDTRTFANDTWLRFQPEQYEVTPASTDDCYNFILTITIDTSRFHENGLPIIMELDNANHEKRTLFSTLVLRNHNGSWMGKFDDHGNLVVTQTVRQYLFFSSNATHSLSLGQRTSKYEIHGIRSLNLKIEKAKIEYPE
jgi:hypothetical protein